MYNILLVAPVTTATVKRSNSVLAYVKTELHSTINILRAKVSQRPDYALRAQGYSFGLLCSD